MARKVFELFSGLTATLIAGVFLVSSLTLTLTKTVIPIAPAWITVVICSCYMLYYLGHKHGLMVNITSPYAKEIYLELKGLFSLVRIEYGCIK